MTGTLWCIAGSQSNLNKKDVSVLPRRNHASSFCRMKNPTIIQLFLLSFLLLTIWSHADPRSSKNSSEEQLKYGLRAGLRWLTDAITWIPWLLRSILAFIYLIINTVVLALTHFMATIFILLHQFMRFIEFVGYLVRLVLQANYNFVSTCVLKTRTIVENSYVFFKELLQTTGRTFIALVKMILDFLHHIVFNMPKLYELTGKGLQTTANMAESVTVKTNSTFRNIVYAIKAVVELFGRSILNTLAMLIDLLYTGFLWCAHFFRLIGKNIIFLVDKVSRILMLFLQRTWAAFETCCVVISTYIKSSFYGGLQLIKAIFSTFFDVILSVLKAIGVFVRYCGRFILNGFFGLGWFVNNTARTITDTGILLISSIKTSKGAVISISCILLIIAIIWLGFKINLFILGFSFLESSIQALALWLIRAIHREQTTTGNIGETANTTPGNEEMLRRQLELERDKTLCVVCQDQVKKILLLPCRHMCICVICANHITSFVHWNRRICPLCRTRIGSMVEVYS